MGVGCMFDSTRIPIRCYMLVVHSYVELECIMSMMATCMLCIGLDLSYY